MALSLQKWTGSFLLVLLLLQFDLPTLEAATPYLSEPSVPAFASTAGAAPATSTETQGDKTQKTPDEAFVERSQKAEKFTFTDLPKHLGYDLKESFWGFGSLGLGIGLALTAGLHEKDDEIQFSFKPHALFGDNGDKVLQYVGAPYTMGGVGLIAALVGGFGHNEKLATTGEAVMEALFWTQLFTYGIKVAADRTRPDGTNLSFPSAHASGVFSTATVFQVMYGPKVGVPFYAFATAVSLSRVDSYKHFPSDVLFGAVLGSVIGFGTARYHKNLHHNFSLTPTVQADQYGLLLQSRF